MRKFCRLNGVGLIALTVGATLVSAGTAFAAPEEGGTNLAQAIKKQVLVFPFDTAAISQPFSAELGEVLTDKAMSRFLAAGSFTVTAYRKSLPTIVRLNSDQQLTETDISAPFAEDVRKAVKVGKAAMYDLVFVGSIDEYTYDEAKKEASVTASGRLVEVETGKILKSATVSATGSGNASAKEDERASTAARNAGDKVMTDVVPMMAAPVQQPTSTKPIDKPSVEKKKKKGGGQWLWGLLAVGLGLGLGLSGRSGGGSLDSGPPAPPGR